MANNTQRYVVSLGMNSDEATRKLAELKNQATALNKQLAEAQRAGNNRLANQIRRTLNQTNADIRRFNNDLQNVDRVMSRLSKSSIKEMEEALRVLQRRIKTMDRDTPDFNRTAMRIRALREELAGTTATLRTQESAWSRFNNTLNNCQTSIMAAIGALTGIVMAARKAVDAYAGMEQEMANVRKFTGMTSDEVETLNEKFGSIDTRTGREELNKLAQEAGRLGKTSPEDVLGYVRAADKINVALDDLGENATLTLSKLTGIFGDEQRLGTEKALLSVGSVVNELSQNCSASAPYLTEFASRLGGVGSQANMTVQQIMAYGAVLDSNNQKVEASATALSQIIVRLYQDPAKYAEVAGMDVQKFTQLVKTDMNAALLTFLDTLNKAGNMNVLSPMFKDMGENGSRAISALSTLAGNIDAVRSQQEAANQAFAEATSIDKEFDVQNNTVQASIDKAKKSVNELAVELGEKLYPMMRHIYTSSSVFLRVLNTIVKFIIDNRKALSVLVGTIASYYTALGVLYLWQQRVIIQKALMTAGSKALAFAMGTLRAVVAGLRLVWIALTQGMEAARVAYTAMTATMATNPFGAIAAAVGLVISAIISLKDTSDDFKDSLDELMPVLGALDDQGKQEQEELDQLIGQLRGAEKGSEDYRRAKEALNARYGIYLKALYSERGAVISVGEAYGYLSEMIKAAAYERQVSLARTKTLELYQDDLIKQLRDMRKELVKDGIPTATIETIMTRVTTSAMNRDLKALKNAVSYVRSQSGSAFDIGEQVFRNAEATNGQIRVLTKMINQASPWRSVPNKNIYGYNNANGKHVDGLVDVFSNAIENGKGVKIEMTEASARKIFPERYRPENPFTAKRDPFAIKQIPDYNKRVTITLNPQETKNAFRGLAKEAFVRSETGMYKRPEETKSYTPESASATKSTSGPASSGKSSSKSSGKPSEKDQLKKVQKEIDALKEAYKRAQQEIFTEYAMGTISYGEYLKGMGELEQKFYDDRLKVLEDHKLTNLNEYKKLLEDKEKASEKSDKEIYKNSTDELEKFYDDMERRITLNFENPAREFWMDQEAYEEALHRNRVAKIEDLLKLETNDAKKIHDLRKQLADLEADYQLKKQQRLYAKIAEWREKYDKLDAVDKMNTELNFLYANRDSNKWVSENYERIRADIIRQYKGAALPESARQADNGFGVVTGKAAQKKEAEDLADLDKLRGAKDMFGNAFLSEEEYEEAKKRITAHYKEMAYQAAQSFGSEHANMLMAAVNAWDEFFNHTEEGAGNWATRLASAAQATFAIMNAAMSQYSEYSRACQEAEVAEVEAKYEKQLEMAQGNATLTRNIEKKKSREIAEIKKKESDRQFAMKVIEAVSQTAYNALAAYGSAASIPGTGWILAPIAAAMATAAGLLQIATIKKQKDAAAATGYSEGGFTPAGDKEKEVGVVHAGEWVAPQRLVYNPQTRPLINSLEYARTHNRLPSVRPAAMAVSPIAMSQTATRANLADRRRSEPEQGADLSALMKRQTAAVDKLNDRLNEPIAAVATVAGDYGLNRKLEEYNRLMANKAPRYKKIYRYANTD